MSELPTASDPAEAIIAAARALAPRVRAAAAETEAARCLPPWLIQAMQEAGVFRMAMPRAWGGPEIDPLVQIRVVEALAQADGSAGWCAMIGSDGGYVSAFLDQAVAREMYRNLDAVTAFVLRPSGKALPVPGGYRLDGRWSFASGCRHSTWLAVGGLVIENGAPRQAPDGRTELRTFVLPAEAAQVIDTWFTTGVRGSGSHDIAVEDLFVPEERTFTYPFRSLRPGPLYAFPTMFLANMAGVPLGVARAALDALQELIAGRVAAPGADARPDAFAQAAVGEAEALLGSARGYVFDVVGDLWRTLLAGEAPTVAQRIRLRLAQAHCTASCLRAVELAYRAGGGASLYARSPLDRCLRDMQTISQHIVLSPRVYEEAGGALLGLELRPFF